MRLRCGKPTASEFSKIITPKLKQPTKGETRRGYKIYLLTELILDTPLSTVTTAAMNHGTNTEETARAAYEMQTGIEVDECGFVTNDEGTYGASPDSFVGPEGILEIKSAFNPAVHVGYLMDNDTLEEEYRCQLQGQLLVCERKWTDIISYVPGLPMVQVRVLPDPDFQEKLGLALRSFCAEFSDLVHRAVDLGYLKETPPTTDWIAAGDGEMVRNRKQQPEGDFEITDDEIARIWANRGEQTDEQPKVNNLHTP